MSNEPRIIDIPVGTISARFGDVRNVIGTDAARVMAPLPHNRVAQYLATKTGTIASVNYEGVSGTFEGLAVALPSITLANFSRRDFATLDTATAILRHAIASGALNSQVAALLTTATANGFSEFLAVGDLGISRMNTVKANGQAFAVDSNGIRKGDDTEIEVVVATQNFHLSGNGGIIQLLDTLWYEFSHSSGVHKFAYGTQTPLAQLSNAITSDTLNGDVTYSGGRTLTSFIAEYARSNPTITVDGKSYDLTSLAINANDVQNYYENGLLLDAQEQYENRRIGLSNQILESIYNDIDQGIQNSDVGQLTPEVISRYVAQGFLVVMPQPVDWVPGVAGERWGDRPEHYRRRTVRGRDINRNGQVDSLLANGSFALPADIDDASEFKEILKSVSSVIPFSGVIPGTVE